MYGHDAGRMNISKEELRGMIVDSPTSVEGG